MIRLEGRRYAEKRCGWIGRLHLRRMETFEIYVMVVAVCTVLVVSACKVLQGPLQQEGCECNGSEQRQCRFVGLKIADCLISATGSFTVSSSFKSLIDLLMVEENLVILR